MSQHTGSYAQIRDNPKFISLIAKRNSYAFLMTALMMFVYYGYILLIAFDKEWLATKIGAGYVTSIGNFLQQYYIYAVEWVANGYRVGMRGKELMSLDNIPDDILDGLGPEKKAQFLALKGMK